MTHATPVTIIDNDTGAVSSQWTFSMTPAPSTPIIECLALCTAEERAALKDGKLPHVRTWGDLETVRAQEKPIAAKVKAE